MMKIYLIICALFIVALNSDKKYKNIVVFGDSITDTGRLWNMTKKMHAIFGSKVAVIPPSPP